MFSHLETVMQLTKLMVTHCKSTPTTTTFSWRKLEKKICQVAAAFNASAMHKPKNMAMLRLLRKNIQQEKELLRNQFATRILK